MKSPIAIGVLFLAVLTCDGIVLRAQGPAAAVVKTDIEYGLAGGESLKLDAYVPEGAGPFPAVILVHGGGWNAGDKSGGPKKNAYMVPMQEPLQRAGFAWFSINYRLAPKNRFPANLEDVQTAIRWVKAHAAEYHLDPKRIAISGESAGGHLVALAVVKADERTRVAAAVPFYGVFDMAAMQPVGGPVRPNFEGLFGHDAAVDPAQRALREASPITYVKAGLPPFLLVHGTVDDRVPPAQSDQFQAKLQAAGVKCDLIKIPGGVHGMISWDKVAPGYQEKVVAWLKQTLDEQGKKGER